MLIIINFYFIVMNRSKTKKGKAYQLPLFITKLLEMVEVMLN